MTGVSLAGTQLRVNTYHSERKDDVVTINGAVVSGSKRDIPVPQGVAHAVDRVLFPLPVGDLVQTLKGDRERRFGKFVKSIEASGLEDILTGGHTGKTIWDFNLTVVSTFKQKYHKQVDWQYLLGLSKYSKEVMYFLKS